MKKQYFHKMQYDMQGERFTAVVEVPTKEEMTKILTLNLYHKLEVKINCGITIVSPKDQYCKAIGRQFALKEIQPYTFKLNEVTTSGDGKSWITLLELNELFTLQFECKHDRNKLYLIGVIKH